MRARIAVLCLIVVLFGTLAKSACSAGEGDWIVKYRVEDLKTGQVVLERDFPSDTLTEYAPIFEGGEYNVTITIKVTMAVPRATLTLRTNLDHSTVEDIYWKRHTSPPPAIVDYNPDETSVEFRHEKGDLVVSLYGKIRDDITEQRLDGGVVLHKTARYTVVELRGPGFETLDNIVFDVIDAKIDGYRILLQQRNDDLQSFRESKPRVVSSYIELFESVIDQAEEEAAEGFVDKAIALLNLLETDDVPTEYTASWMETFFIPIVGGLVVVAVIAAASSARTKGKLSYVLLVIEDQIRDLEGLTLRVSRLDRTISSRLESVKDRLKALVGG